MPTHWRRYKRCSRCSLSPLQQHLPLQRSWDCGTEKYRDYCGKTTETGNCTFPAQSGMAGSRTPKLGKGRAPVPVIRQLADRLEMHRLRSGNPQTGPIFANSVGNPLSLGSMVNRVIPPSLNRCETCGKKESDHQKAAHVYKRDACIPEWQGWHAARRGLGSNLYRLGVPDMVIQRILRHANVSTTATYYIKTAAGDVRNAMAMLEDHLAQAARGNTETVTTTVPEPFRSPDSIQ